MKMLKMSELVEQYSKDFFNHPVQIIGGYVSKGYLSTVVYKHVYA